MEDTKKAEERKDELIKACRHCQGSDSWDIICVNGDCPVFYRRPKAIADHSKLDDQLKNLKW